MRNKDEEYLARPLLEGVNHTITNDFVSLQTESGGYITDTRISLQFTKESLMGLYKSVCHKARELNVVTKKKMRFDKVIKNNWEVMLYELETHNILFDQLVEAAKAVQERGLHEGTDDDEALKKVYDIRAQLGVIHYRTMAYSQICEAYTTLKRHADYLSMIEKSGQNAENGINRPEIYV